MSYNFAGSNINQFASRLGDDWLPLAENLRIEDFVRRRFRQGFEGHEIVSWLRQRQQLDKLPHALREVGRDDLEQIFVVPEQQTGSAAAASWTDEDTNLRDILSGLYVTHQEMLRIADEAGLNRARLEFNGNARVIWHEIVKVAKLSGKRDALVKAALADNPDNPALLQAARHDLTDIRGTDIEKNVQWNPGADSPTLEKIIGDQSTILPISFLEAGLHRSRSVARIVRNDGAVGSGFLIAGNLLVTNHHVLRSEDEARLAKVQFNVQRTIDGLDLPSEQFNLAPSSQDFLTSEADDFTIVRLGGDANSKWGAIPLKPAKAVAGDRVIIIQHPGGGPKSIALYHNIITYADDRVVQYLTDTMPGSSGSPVFDSSWNVVAIHHSGGWLREPGSKQNLFRNEGIAISRLLSSAGRFIS